MRTIINIGAPLNVFIEKITITDDRPQDVMVHQIISLAQQDARGFWISGPSTERPEPFNQVDQTSLYSEREKLLVRWAVGVKASIVVRLEGPEPPVLFEWKPCRIINEHNIEFAGSFRLMPLNEKEARMVFEERHIEALESKHAAASETKKTQKLRSNTAKPKIGQRCNICGWVHDLAFTSWKNESQQFTLTGVLPDIVRIIHESTERGVAEVSTSDPKLMSACGNCGRPGKAFHERRKKEAYKLLFKTANYGGKKGFISFR